jgi:hypothetical protein
VDKKVCYLCLRCRDCRDHFVIHGTCNWQRCCCWTSLVIHNTQPQDPQPPQSPLHAHPGDLDLPLHRTQSWNQAHNRRNLPILTQADMSQKCRLSGEKLGEFRTRHGLLASASILCRETSSLYCRLRMKASHGNSTCGTFLVVS